MASKFTCGSSQICLSLLAIILLLGIIATLATYFIGISKIKSGINDFNQVCDLGSDQLSSIKTPPNPLALSLWVFTISNPLDYLTNGSTIGLSEFGPFTFDLTTLKDQVRFSDGGSKMTYVSWSTYNHIPSSSCSACTSPYIQVNLFNLAYTALILRAATNEISLLLSLACSQSQLFLMQSGDISVPICTASQQATSFMCRCCDLTNTANASCSSTISPTSRVAGLVSWVTKYDGGTKISSSPSPGFPLADGVYSPLVSKSTVSQALFGHPTALVGFLQTAKYAATIATPTSSAAQISSAVSGIQDFSDLTRDMSAVCLPLFCPQLSSITSLLALRNADCSGFIPKSDILQAKLNMTSSQAMSLRYLEGVDCGPFTVTFAVAAYNKLIGYSAGCFDPKNSPPCCALSNGLHIPGLGCLQWVNGLATPRRVFSAAEALQRNNATSVEYTGCVDDDSNKFHYQTVSGVSSYLNWFIPSATGKSWTYASTYQQAVAGTLAGAPFNAKVFSGNTRSTVGTGLGSMPFLGNKLSKDDAPYSTRLGIFAVTRSRALPLRLSSTENIKGVTVNRFVNDYNGPADPANVPYPNMINLMYTRGIPLVASTPYFYGSNATLLSQNDNSLRMASPGGGIAIYRTVDGVSSSAKSLSSPVRVDAAYLRQQDPSQWSSYVLIEPASGIILDGSVADMLSVFTSDCNPASDATCQMGIKLGSTRRCYGTFITVPGLGIVPADFPCSAYNVFTPAVQGGKIIPLGWVRQSSKVTGIDSFGDVVRSKFILDIIVLVIPVVAGLIAVSLVAYVACHRDRMIIVSSFTNAEKAEEPVDKPVQLGRGAAYSADP